MKNPTVCFVCYHGIGVSAMVKEWFNMYLQQHKIDTLNVINAGIQDFIAQREPYVKEISEADFVVLARDIDTTPLETHGIEGKLLTMDDIQRTNEILMRRRKQDA